MKVKKNISTREAQVASLMIIGLKSKEVAKVLGLSQKSIGTYLRRWKEYLGAPLVGNHIALLWITPKLEGKRDFSGVLPEYKNIVIEISRTKNPEKINSLIKKLI